MSEPSEARGYRNCIIGTVKENFGQLTGNEGLEGSGREQRVKGDCEIKAAKAINKTYADNNNMMAKLGGMLGNEQMHSKEDDEIL